MLMALKEAGETVDLLYKSSIKKEHSSNFRSSLVDSGTFWQELLMVPTEGGSGSASSMPYEEGMGQWLNMHALGSIHAIFTRLFIVGPSLARALPRHLTWQFQPLRSFRR